MRPATTLIARLLIGSIVILNRRGLRRKRSCWRAWRDSNPQPSDPKLVPRQNCRKQRVKQPAILLLGPRSFARGFLLIPLNVGHSVWAQTMGMAAVGSNIQMSF